MSMLGVMASVGGTKEFRDLNRTVEKENKVLTPHDVEAIERARLKRERKARCKNVS
jgi:hypothetical protein